MSRTGWQRAVHTRVSVSPRQIVHGGIHRVFAACCLDAAWLGLRPTRADQPPASRKGAGHDGGRDGEPPPERVADAAPDRSLNRRLHPLGSCIRSVSSSLRGLQRSLPYRRHLGCSCTSGQCRAQRCFSTRRAGAGHTWNGTRSDPRSIGHGCGDGAPPAVVSRAMGQ